jgi:hypothetical protein
MQRQSISVTLAVHVTTNSEQRLVRIEVISGSRSHWMPVPETTCSMEFLPRNLVAKGDQRLQFYETLATQYQCRLYYFPAHTDELKDATISSGLLREYRCYLASFNQLMSCSRLLSSCTDPVGRNFITIL